MDGMGGMTMSPPSAPPITGTNSSMSGGGMKKMSMMHMTFFWGKNTEILFHGWPGTSSGMYALSLIVVFVFAALVEWISRCRFVKSDAGDCVRGFVLTLLHVIRMGLAYLVMLAVMSFNGGVFLAAVAGHGVGFLVFGTRVFRKGDPQAHNYYEKTGDLPPLSC